MSAQIRSVQLIAVLMACAKTTCVFAKMAGRAQHAASRAARVVAQGMALAHFFRRTHQPSVFANMASRRRIAWALLCTKSSGHVQTVAVEMDCAWMAGVFAKKVPLASIAAESYARQEPQALRVSIKGAQGIVVDMEFASMGNALVTTITLALTAQYQRSAMALATMFAWLILPGPLANSAKDNASHSPPTLWSGTTTRCWLA